jgi:LacI family transcriptional regulator
VATMTMVADAAGVSIATVSAVVNGKDVVRPALIARVREAIAATGYQPNAAARTLKLGRTGVVGVIVPDIANPFFAEIVSVIQAALDRADYGMMLCVNAEGSESQARQVELLARRGIDGLIVAPLGEDQALRAALGALSQPVVFIDRLLEDSGADAVVLDNRAAAREAVRYLAGLGHRRIAILSGPLDVTTGRDRLAGYQDALRAMDIAVDERLLCMGNFTENDGRAATLAMLMSDAPPTALFSANNVMTIGAMKAIRDAGLSCPQDISLLSFDDFPWADVFSPELTSVVQPVASMGEQACSLLIDRIGARSSEGQGPVMLQGQLVIRKSCLPPPRDRLGASNET